MLSFAATLSPNSTAFALFVTEKYDYKDAKGILSKEISRKINLFLKSLKAKNHKDEISSLDISDKKKCFIIKVKNKYENNSPQEKGGSFFANLKHYKKITNIYL